MHERRRSPSGDIVGSEHGDYTDWNNPEDVEDAPEGYYEEADEDDDSYIPGPEDPDYDLSEEAGYAGYEPSRRQTIMPRWVLVAVSIALILAILVPVLMQASR